VMIQWRRMPAVLALCALFLTLLMPAPQAAADPMDAVRDDPAAYQRGYDHGYAACPGNRTTPKSGNLHSDYFTGWFRGCSDAILKKSAPPNPAPEPGTPVFRLPGMVPPYVFEGDIFLWNLWREYLERLYGAAGGMASLTPAGLVGPLAAAGAALPGAGQPGDGVVWATDNTVSGIHADSTAPFSGLGPLTHARTYRIRVDGQEAVVPVYTYKTSAGVEKIFSSGLPGAVSPDGRYAVLQFRRGDEQRLSIVTLPQGDGCTAAAPCEGGAAEQVIWSAPYGPLGIRLAWSPDSRRVAFTTIAPYSESRGFIATVGVDRVDTLDNTQVATCYVNGYEYNCHHSDIKWTPDGQRLILVEPSSYIKTYVYPFPPLRLSRGAIKTIKEIGRGKERIDNVAVSPDGKWLAVTHRLCWSRVERPAWDVNAEDCGWFYGRPSGYIGLINMATGEEHQLTPLALMPAGMAGDLVWLDTAGQDGAAPFPSPGPTPAPSPGPGPVPAPDAGQVTLDLAFMKGFRLVAEGGVIYLEARSILPDRAGYSFRLRSSTGVPYPVAGPVAERQAVVKVALPALPDDTYQVDAFAALEDGIVLRQISAAAVVLSQGGGIANDIAPPNVDGSTPVDPVTGRLIDPETGKPVDPFTGNLIDPITGKPIDPDTGRPIDLITGKPIDVVLSKEPGLWVSRPLDPVTGRLIDPVVQSGPVKLFEAPGIDPVTGEPVTVVISKPIDPVSGKPIDPLTGQPVPVEKGSEIAIWGGARVLTPEGQTVGPDLYMANQIPGFSAEVLEPYFAQNPAVYTGGTITPDTGWDLRAVGDGGKVRLTWRAQTEAVLGYYVYRGEAPGFAPGSPTTDFPVDQPAFTDKFAEVGKRYYYRVRPVLASGAEGEPSPEVVYLGTGESSP